MYVDHGIHAGDTEFVKECDKTQARFKSKPGYFDNFKFTGMLFNTTEDCITLQLLEYTKRIQQLPQNVAFRKYRSYRQKLQWLAHTRPHIACAVKKSTQVTEPKYGEKVILDINSII